MKRKGKGRKKGPQLKPRGEATTAPSALPKRAVLVPSLFGGALVIALYMAWHSITGQQVAGCGAESGCEEVLGSRWGSLLGMPVSFFGAVLYGLLLREAVRRGPFSSMELRLKAMAGYLVLAGALWFTFVQAVLLKAFCPWCCTAHALASLGVVIPRMKPGKEAVMPVVARSSRAVLAGVSVAMVAAVATVQGLAPKPEHIQRVSVGSGDLSGPALTQGGADLSIDPAGLPWIGTPHAIVTGVVVTDFTCPHCRELHQTLEKAGHQLPGRFGVALLPGYHEAEARELHRVMLALWKMNPAEYERVSHAILEETIAPKPVAVMGAMRPDLRGRFYQAAWEHGEWIEDTLRLGRELTARNEERHGLGTLPQLMIGAEVVAGQPRLDTVLAMAQAAPGGLPSLMELRVVAAVERPTVLPPVAGSTSKLAAPLLGKPVTTMSTATAPVPASRPVPLLSEQVTTIRTRPVSTDPPVPIQSIRTPVPVLAAQPPTVQPPSGFGGPKIEFAATAIDLGKVNKGEVAQARFEFKNVGDAPLQLIKLKPQCGCTSVEGWQQTVAPGAGGWFEVKLDTSRFNGGVTKSIAYDTNEKNGQGHLSIKAEVWTPVLVSASSVSFGSLIKGASVAPRPIQIVVQDEERIELGEITGSNPYFEWVLESLEEGRRYTLMVSIPELGEKPQYGEIVIPLGHSKLKEVRLPVYANPVDPLVIQPRELLWSTGQSAAAGGVPVTISCHDPKVAQFEVREVAYTGAQDVKAVLEMRPGYRWGTIRVTFPEGFDAVAAQERKARISFKTNHPDFAEVSIPVVDTEGRR